MQKNKFEEEVTKSQREEIQNKAKAKRNKNTRTKTHRKY